MNRSRGMFPMARRTRESLMPRCSSWFHTMRARALENGSITLDSPSSPCWPLGVANGLNHPFRAKLPLAHRRRFLAVPFRLQWRGSGASQLWNPTYFAGDRSSAHHRNSKKAPMLNYEELVGLYRERRIGTGAMAPVVGPAVLVKSSLTRTVGERERPAERCAGVAELERCP